MDMQGEVIKAVQTNVQQYLERIFLIFQQPEPPGPLTLYYRYIFNSHIENQDFKDSEFSHSSQKTPQLFMHMY